MRGWQSLMHRRKFVSLTSRSGITVLCAMGAGVDALANKKSETADDSSSNKSEYLKKFGPIDRTLGETAPRQYFGDENTRPHNALWDLEKFLANRKVDGADEETDLVIIGGGASGLFSAYTFRQHKPIVLEQASRLGGNAKGQAWRGIDYALGSAYVDSPHAGHPMATLFDELKLRDVLVPRNDADPVEYRGKLYGKFWEGESDPGSLKLYQQLGRFLEDMAGEKQRPFPLIPALTPGQLESVRHYDQWNLHQLLADACGGKIPQQLDTAIEHYCWSTYAGSAREVSAAGAINFLAQEAEPIWVGAGGNAKILEHLTKRLLSEMPAKNLRTSSLAVKVAVEGSRVVVTYEDAEGKLRRVRAKSAIMACPKFVAARILDGIEPARREAIAKLRYRSYMTANVLINKKMARGPYDVFLLGDARGDFKDVCAAQDRMNGTDFVMANFAQVDAKFNVLTFYRAFPCDGMRAQLNTPNSHDDYRKRFEAQLERDILPMLKLSKSDVVDIRLALWGHALPLTSQGIYRDGTIEALRAPFRDRIFFVEQDNWAYPSLQTGATEVALQKAAIAKAIG